MTTSRLISGREFSDSDHNLTNKLNINLVFIEKMFLLGVNGSQIFFLSQHLAAVSGIAL